MPQNQPIERTAMLPLIGIHVGRQASSIGSFRMAKAEKTRGVFRSLVANARDFLVQSLSSLEENPKISLIQFSAAVELFLKARLVIEHWSLIFEHPGKADLSKFLNGELKSVGFAESLERLNRIADAGISQQAIECFGKLQSHRNRLVHFAHPAYSQPATREIRESVVTEQLRAWYHLHQLFYTKWYSDFSDVMPVVSDLNSSMHKRSDYLQVKFCELADRIKKQQAAGVAFAQCPSCGFTAFGSAFVVGPFLASACLVCGHNENKILAHCPSCASESLLSAYDDRACPRCARPFTIEDLLHEHAPKSPEGELTHAHCDRCKYTRIATVIPMGKGWLCVYCISPHLRVSRCEWCGETVTGETGSFHSPGCFMCTHHILQEAYDE